MLVRGSCSWRSRFCTGRSAMVSIQPSHAHLRGRKVDHPGVRAAPRGASWTQDSSSELWRGCLPRPSAVQELFRRWPSVPSRELERIRGVLLHCDEISHSDSTHRLSEPAQTLLDLVTGELERRREAGNHQPFGGSPAAGARGMPTLARGRRQGELL